MTTVYRVTVAHNLVQAIDKLQDSDSVQVARTNLEAGEAMAQNNQQHGCLDGSYYFDDPERARHFALLCMDFVKRVIEERDEVIQSLDTGDEYEGGCGTRLLVGAASAAKRASTNFLHTLSRLKSLLRKPCKLAFRKSFATLLEAAPTERAEHELTAPGRVRIVPDS